MRHLDRSLHAGPRHVRRVVLPVLALTAALAAGACGGDESADTSAKQSSAAPESAAGKPGANVEDQLGFDTAGIMARQSRVEAAIGDCMKNEGFDYVPVDPLA
jgi:hypothetical protein